MHPSADPRPANGCPGCPGLRPFRMPEPALKRTVTMTNREGMHLRPASLIVTEARKYDARVVIAKGLHAVDATDILEIISLGAAQGDSCRWKVPAPRPSRPWTPSNNSS